MQPARAVAARRPTGARAKCTPDNMVGNCRSGALRPTVPQEPVMAAVAVVAVAVVAVVAMARTTFCECEPIQS